MERRLRWHLMGTGRGIDAVMTALIEYAGIAMPRWAFMQYYGERGFSGTVIERCAMERPDLTIEQAARLESFESAVKRGWFIIPEWLKSRA